MCLIAKNDKPKIAKKDISEQNKSVDVGKYYELRQDKFYFSVSLQRKVMFDDRVVVKCKHTCSFSPTTKVHFGALVELGNRKSSTNYSIADCETLEEIEFCNEDVVGEYEFVDKEMSIVASMVWK